MLCLISFICKPQKAMPYLNNFLCLRECPANAHARLPSKHNSPAPTSIAIGRERSSHARKTTYHPVVELAARIFYSDQQVTVKYESQAQKSVRTTAILFVCVRRQSLSFSVIVELWRSLETLSLLRICRP
jgi:hypothetical protein